MDKILHHLCPCTHSVPPMYDSPFDPKFNVVDKLVVQDSVHLMLFHCTPQPELSKKFGSMRVQAELVQDFVHRLFS